MAPPRRSRQVIASVAVHTGGRTSSRPPGSSVSPDTQLASFKKLQRCFQPTETKIKKVKFCRPESGDSAQKVFLIFETCHMSPDGGGSSDGPVELRRRNFSQFSNSSNLPLRPGTPKFPFLQKSCTEAVWTDLCAVGGWGGGSRIYAEFWSNDCV